MSRLSSLLPGKAPFFLTETFKIHPLISSFCFVNCAWYLVSSLCWKITRLFHRGRNKMTIVEARDDVSNMLLYFVVAEFELRTGKWVLIKCNTGQCNRAHHVLFCVFYKQSGFDSQTWQTHTLCWYDLVTALLSVTAWRSNFYVVVSVPWTCLREWPTEVIERVPSKER